MAKIGNEVTLILQLAKEKMLTKTKIVEKDEGEATWFISGYKTGVRDYDFVLAKIVEELEGK